MKYLYTDTPEVRQQLFDAICEHAMKQYKQAIDIDFFTDKPSCRYRASDGTRCFVGAVIPDDRYQEEMEDKEPHAKVFSHLWNIGMGNFLYYLQKIHDGHKPDLWFDSLKDFANEFNLNTNQLERAAKEYGRV